MIVSPSPVAVVPESIEMVALKRLQKMGTIPEPEVRGKGKERATEPRVTVSEIERPGGESSKGKGKARITISELEQGESSRTPTIGNGAFNRQAQRETEDQERVERRRLRMLSNGHPDRCTCPLCPTDTPVQESLCDLQESLCDDIKEGKASTAPKIEDGMKEGEASTAPTVEDGLKEGDLSTGPTVEDVDLDALASSTNLTALNPDLGRRHQWSIEDPKRTERRRLNILSDGHAKGCECEPCSGKLPVQKCRWDEL